ncbi:MAG: hypothetical protein PV362_12985 [Providencia heimbachae]|nr:hypothetical protein [Providencia heimbachae]MBP6122071.1 hypothetical protein [Providencia sp.]MDD9340538.1 hypothetical protein [Providencia heimbachae]
MTGLSPAACGLRSALSSRDALSLRDRILRQKFATRLKIVHLDVITNIQ